MAEEYEYNGLLITRKILEALRSVDGFRGLDVGHNAWVPRALELGAKIVKINGKRDPHNGRLPELLVTHCDKCFLMEEGAQYSNPADVNADGEIRGAELKSWGATRVYVQIEPIYISSPFPF